MELTSSVEAWGGKGHLVVARIAHDILEVDSPDTIEAIESILRVLQKSDPGWTTKEGKHPMVECVTFADDIKRKGGGYQSGWHFVDTPLLDKGAKLADFNFTSDAHNITEAIDGIVAWFNKDKGYQNSYIYKTITTNGVKGHTIEDAQSTAMRLLIHYVGDIHQPLHCTSRINKEYPSGDRGGNDVPIKTHKSVKELHAVWDDVVYELVGHDDLPYSQSDWEAQGKLASAMNDKYKITSAQVKNMNSISWGQESFQISKEFIYKTVVEHEALSDDYVSKGRVIAEKQIVLAGHRLANLLKSLNLEEFLSVKQGFLQM